METTPPIQAKTPLASPALKAVLGFSAGIITCRYCELDPVLLAAVLFAGIIILFASLSLRRTGDICTLMVMFFSGMLACAIQSETGKSPEIPEKLVNQTVKIEGIVTGNVRYYQNAVYFKLKCLRMYHNSDIFPVRGLLPVTLYRKKMILYEGSRIIAEGKIKKLLSPVKQNRTWLTVNTASERFIYRLSAGSETPHPVVLKEGKSFFSPLRNNISSLIDRYPYFGYDGLLRAMLIGDKSGLPIKTRIDFSRSGIAHILAVSGLHAGIVALAVAFILMGFPVSKKTRNFITIFILFIYAGVCGFRPPVTRTFIMVALFMAGMIFERPKNTENTLFIALLIILAFNPLSLFSPSLELSFTAVWAITTFYSPVHKPVSERFGIIFSRMGKLQIIVNYVISVVIVSAIAFTATAPLVAWHFGSLPLLSIVVNVAAVPLAFGIVYTGICSVFFSALGSLAEPVAALFSFITGLFLFLLNTLAEFVAKLPFSSIETGRLSAFTGLCLFTWLYILSRAGGRNGFKKALLYIPLLFLVLFTWSPLVSYSGFCSDEGSILFFDVGQGDSALIEYGNNRYFLVDTGTRSAVKSVVVPSLKNMGVNRLDGVFLSHPDDDHTGGLDYLMKNIKIERIYCGESVKDSLEALHGACFTGIAAGDSIAFKDGAIIVLSPLSQPAVFRKYGIAGKNNNSLILRFNIHGAQVLFAGDIETKTQRLMVSWGSVLDCTVLKVPHHGGKILDPEFVEAVNPELAIISCGVNNSYGHPASSTIETLNSYRIRILRTDIDGSIEVNLPGLEIMTE